MEKRIPYIGAAVSFALFLVLLLWPANPADTSHDSEKLASTSVKAQSINSRLALGATARTADSLEGSDSPPALASPVTSSALSTTSTFAAGGLRPTVAATTTTTPTAVATTTIALTTTTLRPTTTTTLRPTTTTAAPTTTTVAPTTTTTVAPTTTAAPTTTTTVAPTTTLAPTTTTIPYEFKDVVTPGGSIIIRYRPGEVHLESATPFIGFEVKVHDNGPSRVVVVFELDDLSFRITARWIQGVLDVTVDTDDD